MSRRHLPPGVRERRGRFQARWRDPGGRERTATFDTVEEAAAHRAAMLAARRTGSYRDPLAGTVRLVEWVEAFLSTEQTRPSTRARDESYWRTHVASAFGTWPLDRITPHDVQSWVASLSAKGLAPGSVHKIHQVLSKSLQAAVLDGRIASNPCRLSRLPVVTFSEARFLTAAELLDLEAAVAASSPHWSVLVPFLAETALRIGEAAALRVGDVDVDACLVHVRRTAVEVHGRLIENEPKTAAGRRTVPMLTEETAQRLGERVRRLGLTDSSHIFQGPSGGTLRVNGFRARVWRTAIQQADLAAPPPTIHSLRHSAVALWIAAGVTDGYRLARWAGHRDVATVYRVYGHLLPHDASAERAALSRLREDARARRSAGVEPGEVDDVR